MPTKNKGVEKMKFTIPEIMFGEKIDGAVERYTNRQRKHPQNSAQSTNISTEKFSGVMDITHWLNGERKSQNDWIRYANNNNLIMISAPDLYNAGKSGNNDLIQSLRKDFEEECIISGTQIIYNMSNLEAKIIHYEINAISPVESQKIIIPNYNFGRTLTQVLSTDKGIKYLQTLFNTTDPKQTIEETLYALSGKDGNQTMLFTPDQSSRSNIRVRSVGFAYDHRFLIDCYNTPNNHSGRSRGVR